MTQYKKMKKGEYLQIISFLVTVVITVVALVIFTPQLINAQEISISEVDGNNIEIQNTDARNDPIELQEKPIIVSVDETPHDILSVRPLEKITIFNFFAYIIREAVNSGVPADTVALTLLLPVLATLVAFSKNIIGLRSFSMIVVITTSIAFLASNILIGNILFAVILFASIIARTLFKKLKIMQIPKISLSIFFVSLFVLVSFGLLASIDFFNIESISIVPILLFIILSEKIVRLQFDTSLEDSIRTVINSLFLGILGYFIFSVNEVRDTILIYPELVLLLIPINIAIGRYFGLRLTERLRFDLLKK